MTDADTRRDHAKAIEGLHAPLQKLIPRVVAAKFHLHVSLECLRIAREINLHRMIDHEIDRNQRLDHTRVLVETNHCGPHSREIDQQRNAGKILKQHARDHERNLLGALSIWLPISKTTHVLFRDFHAVEIAQHRLKHNANADRQPRNLSDAFLLELGQRIKLSGLSRCWSERLK